MVLLGTPNLIPLTSKFPALNMDCVALDGISDFTPHFMSALLNRLRQSFPPVRADRKLPQWWAMRCTGLL